MNEIKTYTELGYIDVDEAYYENMYTNPHHFHYYDSGMVTYKQEYIHLYKAKWMYVLQRIVYDLLRNEIKYIRCYKPLN